MAAVSTEARSGLVIPVTLASGSAETGSKSLSSAWGLRGGAWFPGGRGAVFSVGTDGLCFTWRGGRAFSPPSKGKEGKLLEFALDL